MKLLFSGKKYESKLYFTYFLTLTLNMFKASNKRATVSFLKGLLNESQESAEENQNEVLLKDVRAK